MDKITDFKEIDAIIDDCKPPTEIICIPDEWEELCRINPKLKKWEMFRIIGDLNHYISFNKGVS